MIFLEKHYRKIIFLVSTIFLTVSLLNAHNDSATFDEIAHIPAGYSYLTQHDIRLNPEHPPLIKNISATPLLFMNLNFDISQDFWTGKIENHWSAGQWEAGKNLLYKSGNDHNKIIFWSRFPLVILSVFLGLFLFKWGKEYFGIVGGLILFFLYSFDPNILGHNHYVTTDLGIAAFLTFSFYYFLKFIKNPSWKNTLKAGIFLGLMLVTKFSSVVVIPVYGLVLLSYSLFRKIRDDSGIETNSIKKRFLVMGEYFGKAFIASLIALSIIYSLYTFNTYQMPKEVLSETADYWFPTEDSNIKSIYTNKILKNLNESELTRPLAAYLFGPAWMLKRVVGGNTVYFLGEVGNGFTWYFPFVFMIKETLPFLVLLLFSIGYGLSQFFNKTLEDYYKKRSQELKIHFAKNNWQRLKTYIQSNVMSYSLLIFILLYSYLSIQGGLNIGFRHLFPILPFIYILITKTIITAYKNQNAVSRKTFSFAIFFFIFWIAIESVFAYPSYVSYFNQAAGGPKNGYKYVTDSNADWGQDLKRLNKFLDSHTEIEKIRVHYFGGGDIFKTIGENRTILWWDTKRPIEKGWYAISTYFLQEGTFDKKKQPDKGYQWLLKHKPLYQIGTSIMIYKID